MTSCLTFWKYNVCLQRTQNTGSTVCFHISGVSSKLLVSEGRNIKDWHLKEVKSSTAFLSFDQNILARISLQIKLNTVLKAEIFLFIVRSIAYWWEQRDLSSPSLSSHHTHWSNSCVITCVSCFLQWLLSVAVSPVQPFTLVMTEVSLGMLTGVTDNIRTQI